VFTILLQVLGWLTFFSATIALGAWLRRYPSKKNAERTSRTMHLLFWIGIAPPTGFGLFSPGVTQYDQILGCSLLPNLPILLAIGCLGLFSGIYLIIVSSISLWLHGKGTNAIILTKQLVDNSIYKQTRNPMSLGFYLGALGIGLLFCSTYLVFGALIVVIPVHVFYLKYFEELELELRMGQPYQEYKKSVPFLLPRWSKF
jgi:protein-S-isoprenylcysteine O-methyltransferase Ste14